MNKPSIEEWVRAWSEKPTQTIVEAFSLINGLAKLADPTPPEEEQPPKLCNLKEAKQITGYSRSSILRAIEAGKLQVVQLNGRGSRVQFYKNDLIQWVKESASGRSRSLEEVCDNAK